MKNYWVKSGISLLVGIVISCFAVFLLQYLHLSNDYELTRQFFIDHTRLVALQTGVVFILYSWIYFIFNSMRITTIIITSLTLIIGIASSQKLAFRGEPIYPSDIYFLKDATFFIGMIDGQTIALVVGAFLFLLGSIIIYFKKRKKHLTTVVQKVGRAFGIILTTLCLFNIYQFNQPVNKIKAMFNEYTSWISYSQGDNYTKNGVVSGLLYNLKSPALDQPLDYSRSRIEEIYEKYNQEANRVNETRSGILAETNIVFIMNETFSDAHRLEGIQITGGDSLEQYRQLPGQHGNTLSQVYGGGTANVEFEALTGISQEPLNGNVSIPFIHLSQQMDQLPSIADFSIAAGHKLTAIHPHNTTMYKRMDNYQSIGFEQLVFIDDMQFTDKIDRSPYVSDEASYQELLAVMKKSPEKDFVHLVTMQNHMSYEGKYDDVQYEVSGSAKDVEVEYYLKGMEYSDQAVKDLIDTFKAYDEKVMLVFWGDHLPSIYGDEIYDLNGYRMMHETPLLIYSNFMDESENLGTISPIYFINHVLEKTNAPITPFVALLQKLEVALPAFEKNFYLERETGVMTKRSELRKSTQLLLDEYDLILYDITTGKNYSKELGFY